MTRRTIILSVAALGLAAAGCSSSSKTVASTPAAASAGSGTVALGTTAKAGQVLVGSNGHTLYLLETEVGTTSMCTGGCAGTWPALVASSPGAGSGVTQAKLSTANGQAPNQVVYNGHLLYYFAGDSAAGDVNGTSIPHWYPVGADGNKVDKG